MKWVFITGMGRSGTKFLGHILGAAQGSDADHERIANRAFTIHSWYLQDAVYAVPYLQRVRNELEQSDGGNDRVFIDVNGHLRHATDALEEVFPECQILHLVRDPRSVVPSIYLRRNERDAQIMPHDREALEWWLDASVFEQIAWDWAMTTQTLLDKQYPVLQFERLLKDYAYFDEQVLQSLDLKMPEANWQARKERRVNKTRSAVTRKLYAKVTGRNISTEVLRPFAEWPLEQRQSLVKLCDAAAQGVGYTLKA